MTELKKPHSDLDSAHITLSKCRATNDLQYAANITYLKREETKAHVVCWDIFSFSSFNDRSKNRESYTGAEFQSLVVSP
jgi:hypothetical protein